MSDYLRECWEAEVGFLGFRMTRNQHWCGTLTVPICGIVSVRMPHPFSAGEARMMVSRMGTGIYPNRMWQREDCPLERMRCQVVRPTSRKVEVKHMVEDHEVYCGRGGCGYLEIRGSSERLPEVWDVVGGEYEYLYDDSSHEERFRQRCCWQLLESANAFDHRVERLRHLLEAYGEDDARSIDEVGLLHMAKRVKEFCYWSSPTLDATIEQLEAVVLESSEASVPRVSSMHKRLHW